MSKEFKPINNSVDFIRELRKGVKSIGVTKEFYTWLQANIDMRYVQSPNYVPISSFYGIEVYIDE